MDMLSSAYGSETDNDDDEVLLDQNTQSLLQNPLSSYCAGEPQLSRSSPSNQDQAISRDNIRSPQVGYISKRKRKINDLSASGTDTSNERSNIIRHYLESPLVSPVLKKTKYLMPIPQHIKEVFKDHTKPVLSLEWHHVDQRLLLSASLDGSVKLWDVEERKCLATYGFLSGAVRDVEWVTAERVLMAGYNHAAIYMDAGYSREITHLKHDAYVSVTKVHLSKKNLVLTGDFDGRLKLWDLREAKPIKTYRGAGGKILDAIFLPEQEVFVASSDIVRKNAFSQAMNVWDIASGVTLTHQLYFEPFTCPCLKAHASGNEFLAQSNGNYIVLFSAKKSFKLNKQKRFEGHLVSGFDVGFDLSPDGNILCSASSEGKVHFYDYPSTKLIRTLTLTNSACLAVAWNCNDPCRVAVSDWKGNIHLLG